MADYIPETLRDIDDEILRITFQGLSRQENDALINASEGDLTTPVEITDDEIFKQLDALEMKRDKKVENIGYALLKQDAKIEELGTEIKRLQRWQKRIKGRRKGLTWYCVTEMMRTGLLKVTGKFIEIALHKNPKPSAEYATDARGKPDFSQIDARFVHEEEKVIKTIDKDAAIQHFRSTGKAPDGFRINDTGHHLRIT